MASKVVDPSNRETAEYSPVPPIPAFDRVHGPGTRFLVRRTLLYLAAFWAVGLALAALDLSDGLTAFGLGLLVPGGGFLYTGNILLAGIAVVAFPLALGIWWLIGIVPLPPAVWLGAAILAGAGLGANETQDWARWGVPVILVAAIVLTVAYLQIRFRIQSARGRRFNAQIAAEQPVLPVAAPTPTVREAGEEDLKTLRYVMDLGLQPADSWDGFFFVRPEQFREGAVRYQLNFVSYTAAMYQYTCAPAFTGYAAEAQRNMIDKMLQKPVWSYWSLEHLWGNLRWNPDPIIDDNVMYSGYLGLMLGMYETMTGDRRYHEPGCLELRWNDTTIYRHDADTITAALVDNFSRARLGQFPCEPNWIYPMCNTFGINSLLVYDRLEGTNHAEPVVAQVRESYDNGDFCEPDGRLTAARSEYFGFRHPMVGNMGDTITTYFLNPIVPEIGRRTWWLMGKNHLGAEGKGPKHRSWNLIDPGNYGINTDRFVRASLAANAREYGDEFHAQQMEQSLAHRIVEKDGARRYKRLSVWGNLWLALARFSREDGFRGFIQEGIPDAWRRGPVLADAAYPEVLVAKAVSDGTSLDLVLRPGNGPVRTTLAIERLTPGHAYTVTGALSPELAADAEGRALVEIVLNDRLEVSITRAVE
ncbi:linalool dehydratase/isomerase domain-containing protein [Hoyosella subflava]|uniref:Linalool dehydratase/isomerase domain-containing protein n=1 Tax=Hoyosella subflava (strain DSM 45089 / JCM 17490 / NBRC 109087 / DQS3-9A1) TaxID=443218 RepID=F6EI91_HOYSD|nr:hypothetical protein [Hoyosella subflava]AEF41198.1 hypothetical protein AS9A_2751 [Hoyosella subflava DQS3-9A1]